MARRGPLGRVVASVSEHALRMVGAAMVLLAGGVTAASVTTDTGLTVPRDPGVVSFLAETGDVPALVAFGVAHPAYPVAMLVGLVLLALGDDVPLLS